MKKLLKITIIIFLGLVTLLTTTVVIEELLEKEIFLSTDPKFDFIAWSNTVSSAEAEPLLKDFLETSFSNWTEAETWLETQGFKIDTVASRTLSEPLTKYFDTKQRPVRVEVVSWPTKTKGLIFADNWIDKIAFRTWVKIHGQGIGITFTEEPLTIHRINISATIL